MKNIQALIAAEHTPVRELLAKLATEEPGVAIAGEADNEVRAVTLATKLRPDIVLLDLRLPHRIGFDVVRLSRISGLDAAQAILEAAPDTRVILVSNLDAVAYEEEDLAQGAALRLFMEREGIRGRLTLQELCFEVLPVNSPVFVDAEVREGASVRKGRKVMERVAGINWAKVFSMTLLGLLGAWAAIGLVFFVFFLIALITG